MDYGRPTLVTEILDGIASIDNERAADDVMLHAAGDVGRLADAVRRSEGAPRAEIAVAAMDLAITILEHLKVSDPVVDEAKLVAARISHMRTQPSHAANLEKPFTTFALGWGVREKTTLRHRTSNVLHCYALVAELHDVAVDEHHRERDWRRETVAETVSLCLKIVAGERPGISDAELIEMAQACIEERRPVALPSDELPSP